MRITAAVAHQPHRPFKIEAVEIAEPNDEEVLVRIVGVGLCHTDIVTRDRSIPVPLPAVLGHEGAGIVERVGSAVRRVAPGDHVVLAFASCGRCEHCATGRPAYCKHFDALNFGGARDSGDPTRGGSGGSILGRHASDPTLRLADGGALCGCYLGQSSFASHAIAHERTVVKVPRDLPLEKLGPLGCGIQTGAGAVLNALRPPAGSSIAIFGTGSVGLSAVLAAVVAGCTRIIAVDIKPKRLALARELGATHVVNAAEQDPIAEIRRLTDGEGVGFSVECVGNPRVVRQAVEALRITGICGVIGNTPSGLEVSLDINEIVIGRTVRGIVEGDSVPDVFIPRLIELWRQGRFPFDRLITFYALADINEAIADSESGTVLKPVLRP